MVLLIGQVGTDALSREAFQEIDYTRFYGAIAKHVEQVYDPARLPEIMSRAFHTACNGRPGPVVVVLPEDILRERAVVDDVPARQPLHVEPSAGDIATVGRLLAEAKRPMLIAGGAAGHNRRASRFTVSPPSGSCLWLLPGGITTSSTMRMTNTSVMWESE